MPNETQAQANWDGGAFSIYWILIRLRSNLSMFTSAELPLVNGAAPSARARRSSAPDRCPRVSHRVALMVIIGGSLGCYTLLYMAGAWALG